MMRKLRSLVFVLPAIALSFGTANASDPPKAPKDSELPFEVTEDRERCANYAPERQALFGTTHLHTGLSFDASIYAVDYRGPLDPKGNNPRNAYKFAKGGYKIHIPDPSGMQRDGEPLGVGPTRTPEIDEPLDWGAVTDHAEHFGVMGLCKGAAGDDIPEIHSMECRMINRFFYQPLKAVNQLFGVTMAASAFTQLATASDGATSHNMRLPVCENNPELCDKAELAIWGEVRAAAEEAYDRSSECNFTSFIAYENTSSPLGNTWHRNVIFRNDRVAERPITAIDMAVERNLEPTETGISTVGGYVRADDLERVWPVPKGYYQHPLPQPFWNKLEQHCTNGEQLTPGLDSRCDFITIPHNTNLGGGMPPIFPSSFLTPYNEEDAVRHQQMEPLVEIYQIKGSSECRYDPRFGPSENTTTDEQCQFEILDSSQGSNVPGSEAALKPPTEYPPRSYVRNIWKDGMQMAATGQFSVNPFKMGVVAGSDAHTGVMGWHPENEQWPGHNGMKDSFPMADPTSIQYGTGGLSVVWAEENSRDSIFSALKRKEAYGTSGTRIQVRFFGGWDIPEDACEQDFVDLGYSQGVPMGGDLAAPDATSKGPVFVTAAWSDPNLQTPLQQIQIIKASVGKDGKVTEKIVTAAGIDSGPPTQTSLRKRFLPDSCEPKPTEEPPTLSLCGVWRDPHFDAEEYAMYYVRVLEEPVCRYSTRWCQEWIGVNPLSATCSEELDAIAGENSLKASRGAMCCSDTSTEPFVQPVIQERAWTSPIWYEPEAQQ